ncbi:MAG: aromatic ring-hydroxylating dioxygenase subunit alpha [Gammaproteobacteria bacterium]|nr:aromatic ring-hydroxylating dioxygenase subunit alpha [Gammaproteobacteria bacterium]
MSADIFDACHYRAVRRPVEDASTLPPFAYHDAAFYRREVERIFHRRWYFVGHADRVPAPGAYATLDVAGAPVALLRGDDGEVRAFANSCRHRGAQVLEGEGRCARVVCPYHGWTYALDGTLAGARGMEDVRDFDPAEHGLLELRLERLGKLMWICLAEDAPPLLESLGELPALLAPYDLDELVLTRRTEYDVACNWKVYVENFMDYYHTPTVHRASIARGNLAAYHRQAPVVEDGAGRYLCLYARHAGSAALLEGESGFAPLPGLTGRAAQGSTYVCAYPCALLGCTRDCVWYVEIHPTGPGTIRLALGSCFHPGTSARTDFAERVQAYYRRWDVTVDEDNRINERQQRGVASPLARPGRVSPLEALSHTFRNWLLDALEL